MENDKSKEEISDKKSEIKKAKDSRFVCNLKEIGNNKQVLISKTAYIPESTAKKIKEILEKEGKL